MGDDGSFPDLHHKMSKKVAQLTKVIYHLNTRNDDHQYAVKALKGSYEEEIGQILRNCNEKMNKLKKRLESRNDGQKIQQALDKLTAQHEEEKKAAYAEFHQHKKRHEEQALAKAAEVTRLTSEVEERKMAFEARMQEFADAQARNAGRSQTDIDEMIKKHKQELESHTRESNERYNTMLTQRLEAEVKLEEEWEGKLAALRQELEQQAIAKEQAARQAGEAAAQVIKDTLTTQMRESEAKHIAKANGLMAECEGFRVDRKKLESEVGVLQSTLSGEEGKVTALKAKVEQLQLDLQRATEGQETLRSNLAASEGRVSTLSSEKGVLEEQVKELSDKIAAMSEGSQAALRNLESTVKNMRNEIAEGGKKRGDLERDLEKAKTARGKAEEQIAALKAELAKTLADSEAERKRLNSEMQAMKAEYEKKLAALKEQGGASSLQHAEELKRLKAEMAEKLKKETDLLKAQQSEAAAKWKAREAELKAEMEARVKEERQSEQSKAAQAEKVAREKFDKQVEELKKQITKVTQERDEALKELAKTRDSAGTSSEQVKALKKELEAAKAQEDKLNEELKKSKDAISRALKETEGATQQIAKLKKEVADLKQALAKLVKEREAERREHEETTQKKLKDMTNHWTGQVLKEKEDLGTHLKQKHMKDLTEERERLKQEKLEAEAEAKRRLEAAMSKGMTEAGALQNEIERLRSELAAVKEDADAKRKALVAAHTKQIQELEARHKAQVADMTSTHRKELASAVESAENKLQALHKSKLEQIKQQHKQECYQLTTEHESFCAALRSESEAAITKARAEEQRAATARAEALQREVDDMWGNRMSAKDAAHSNEVEDLRSKIEELNSTIKEKDTQLGLATKQQAALEKELQDQQEQSAANLVEYEQWKTHTEEAERKRKELAEQVHREDIVRIQDELGQQLCASEQRYQDMEEESEEKLTELEMRYAQLESKYNRRESRPEDLEKIKHLNDSVIEMQAVVDQTKEEMKYFKLELMNREENFNKAFGGGPNVGVMNPMASSTKTKAQSAGGSKSRTKASSDTSFPSIGASAPQRPSSATRRNVGRRGSGSHAA